MPRLTAKQRTAQLLDTALTLSTVRGYEYVMPWQIAAVCGVSRPLVHKFLGNRKERHTRIVRKAIYVENLRVIGYAVVASHPAVRRIPADLKARAVATL